MSRPAERVLVVGRDGATWRLLAPLLREGDGIPELNLSAWLLREGYLARRESRGTAGIAGRMRGMVLGAGRWARSLLRRGLPSEARLRLKRMFPGFFASAQSYLYFSGVDWERTRAYASYDEVLPRGIRVNLRGREPSGIVPPGVPYEELRAEIMEKLRRLAHPVTAEPLLAGVYRREDLYHGAEVERAPDVVVEWSDRALFPVRAGERPLPPRPPETAFPLSDHGRTGEHRPEGIIALHGSPVRQGEQDLTAEMVDIAPTILYLLGQPVPAEMDGKVLRQALKPQVLADHPPRVSGEKVTLEPREETGYAEEDEEKVRERLRGLGYIQ